MLLLVVVHPRDEFDRWVAAQQAPAREDAAVRGGRELFLSLACINCHTVRGTPANGVFGPDLTHLMSRRPSGPAWRATPREPARVGGRPGVDQARGAHAADEALPRRAGQRSTAYLLTLR